LVYWLVHLAFEQPLIGIPLLIGAALVVFHGVRRGWWAHEQRTIRRYRPARQQHASAVAADALRGRDPDFDEARFLQRVRSAFDKAQAAWCAQDLEPLRAFVSDGVFERFALQIAEQRDDGWRQGMRGLRVGALTIAHVEPGAQFDTVTVRIPFRCEIDRLALETGAHMRGSRLPRDSFIEMWSFLRRRGARTLSGEGLIEGKCPGCGAPLSMAQSAKCGSCGCLARSGQFDWVLTEITQASVWSAERERDIPGLAGYTQRDPGLSVQALEDRASVAFWRRCAADRAGRVDALTRVSAPAFTARYAEELAGRGTYHADCAVGSVRTLGVLPGEEHDRVVLEVVWDGRRATRTAGAAPEVEARRRLHHTLFVFGRAAGAQTSLDDAFTTLHCRTCGAHDAGGTDPACPYCGTPRTGDRTAWLLEEVLERGAAQAQRLLGALRSAVPAAPEQAAPEPSTVELLEWAVALVRADGTVDDDERRAVHSLARRDAAAPELIDALLDADEAPASVARVADPYDARERLSGLVALALTDGAIDARERRFLRAAARELRLPPAELELLVHKTQRRLFEESRAARRHGRAR
jgi:tellurite resistance protein